MSPLKQTQLRLTDADLAMIAAIGRHLNLTNRTAVIRYAINQVARSIGYTEPAVPAKPRRKPKAELAEA